MTPKCSTSVSLQSCNAKVLHIRLAAILQHYGATFADAIKGGLHLISLVGHDAVLGAPERNGKIKPTALYKQLLEAAGDIKPPGTPPGTIPSVRATT
jgi:hypothetical protein